MNVTVIMYQLGLGLIQYLGRKAGGTKGLGVAFIIVVLWTFTQTHGGLLALQFIIQSIAAYILYTSADQLLDDDQFNDAG